MKTCRGLAFVLAVGVLFAATSPASAAVKLPAIFSDNMILQRDQAVPVWGWAKGGAEVSVSIAGQTAKATAGQDGRWKVSLEKLSAGGPHELVVEETGGNKITRKNVLVGEVWVCSGQSNMELPTAASVNGPQEVAAAKYPKIRLFNVVKAPSASLKDDCQGAWAECNPQSVPGFSAIGYFFIRHLYKELDVPCGMIASDWGGTPIEAWMPKEAMLGLDFVKARAEEAAKAAPNPNAPAHLYNGMLNPIIPYGIRGALWYQGESNIGGAYNYRTLMPVMIESWRKAWGQGDFAFGMVQLAPFRYGGAPTELCCELREAQVLTLAKSPNTGLAVTMDIGDPKDIHPKNKQEVGRRFGLWAMAKVYGKDDLVYSGPMYRSMAVENGKIRLAFDHVGGGLTTRDGKAPAHFTIAGADKKFVPATAVMDGNAVVVSSDQVKEPVAVRYGWTDDAEPNLSNKEGLPASPFRTDAWKGLTQP
jgi:sialate O-acetylesterase